MIKLSTDQKGIGAILIIAAVVFVIVAVAVMAYFLLNGNRAGDSAIQQSEQSQSTETTISDDEVPLKVCETGDPEQCNDPVSNEEVDNITNFEDEYP